MIAPILAIILFAVMFAGIILLFVYKKALIATLMIFVPMFIFIFYLNKLGTIEPLGNEVMLTVAAASIFEITKQTYKYIYKKNNSK